MHTVCIGVGAGTLLALTLLNAAGVIRTRNFRRAKYESSELERERALKLATEPRLASLESRIHPHFLFNTLNSIFSLIHSDPAQAEAQLQRLCALLRFSLDASDRLRFDLDVAPELLDCEVSPQAVQTLVENSVMHEAHGDRGTGARGRR
ncbi:MAG: histidine kinase [Acidobacteria bacterium]|nr:histidine kinase [Acidobacteriota bacterium]